MRQNTLILCINKKFHNDLYIDDIANVQHILIQFLYSSISRTAMCSSRSRIMNLGIIKYLTIENLSMFKIQSNFDSDVLLKL